MRSIIFTSVITSSITAIVGFIVFLYSKVYYKIYEKYKDLKVHTSYSIVYYANLYNNPIDLAEVADNKLPENYNKASDELRKLAAEWEAFKQYKIFSSAFPISDKKISKVSSNLIGISNSFTHPYGTKDRETNKYNRDIIGKVKKILKF